MSATRTLTGWSVSRRSFTAPEASKFSVGVHQLAGSPEPLVPGRRLFRFVR
ncbi:MAG: hypothetical protein WKF54_01010 [Nocardioidaceae bacterium]